MTLRRATPDDAAALADLHAQALPAPWSTSAIAALLASPGVIAVAEQEGFALARVAADEAELLTLAVTPGARRQGLGRRLLQAVLEQALAGGASALHLEVAADNAAAIGLYESVGLVRSGLRRGYYARPGGRAEDAVLMRRALNSPAA